VRGAEPFLREAAPRRVAPRTCPGGIRFKAERVGDTSPGEGAYASEVAAGVSAPRESDAIRAGEHLDASEVPADADFGRAQADKGRHGRLTITFA